jgi:hypothetical protein
MLYARGEKVPHAGIYAVTHDPGHAREHEVTCIKGRNFPPCQKLQRRSVRVEESGYPSGRSSELQNRRNQNGHWRKREEIEANSGDYPPPPFPMNAENMTDMSAKTKSR